MITIKKLNRRGRRGTQRFDLWVSISTVISEGYRDSILWVSMISLMISMISFINITFTYVSGIFIKFTLRQAQDERLGIYKFLSIPFY